MDEISALEFLSSGDIRVYFFKTESTIIDKFPEAEKNGDLSSVIDYIRESGDRFYYRTRLREKITWYNKELMRVPTRIDKNLETLSNRIKNILNQNKTN